jgi:aspartyl-tRNA synthetase
MALVAITSVQLTTPMRTFLQEAGSAAITPVLKKAVPLSARTQLLISRFMSGSSAVRLLWFPASARR